jgi:2,3-bisphosphoglycerate-dependent phosphoglycerate mutase
MGNHNMKQLGGLQGGVGRVVFVRHGESVWNITDPARGLKIKFSGWADIPLTPRGLEQAQAAGRCLLEMGIHPDTALTSLLKRSRDTYDEISKILENHDTTTVINSWRLNERHYGALVGLGKEEAKSMFDPIQLKEWRRSWDKAPPKMNNLDLQLWNKAAWTKPTTILSEPGKQKFIINEKGVSLPETESLADCYNRVQPLWEYVIAPKVGEGQTVLIVAHANSIRAMVRYIDWETITSESVKEIHIPPATPLVYEFAITKNTDHDNSAPGPFRSLRPAGIPTPLGMTGRFFVNRELGRLGTTAKHSLHEIRLL